MDADAPISPDTMNATAPDGAPPRRFEFQKVKLPSPAVPRRGPEAGEPHITKSQIFSNISYSYDTAVNGSLKFFT
jgi:hypothetical protein